MDEFPYVEIALGSPRNRGLLVEKKKLREYLSLDYPVYRSTYLYNHEAIEYVQTTKSIKNFQGARDIDHILIDIDKGDNSGETTLERARGFIESLRELGVPETAIQPYFSGTGFHLILARSLFNFQAGTSLPSLVRQTMGDLFSGIDLSIYTRAAIYRLVHTINAKSNLYKIPLSVVELDNYSYQQVCDLAKKPRMDYPFSKLIAEPLFFTTTRQEVVATRLIGTAEPLTISPCIQRMYNNGPQEGNRHHVLLRIASHFKRNGIPSEAAKAALLHWNNNSLEPSVVIEQTDSVYNASYRYGCNDHLMREHCSTRCIYYKRKDYMIDVFNVDDMQKKLQDRMETDYSGRVMELGRKYTEVEDTAIYPGELLTIVGPTGVNKTALAENLVLGYNALQDTIETKQQLPTLFLSLELGAWLLHRRNLQIVSNTDKKYVTNCYDELFELNRNKLDHVAVQLVSPSIDQIRQKIRELQPKVVVVDYIEHIDVPSNVGKGEYERLTYVSHALRNIAVNDELIIIQISQVKRDYGRQQVMDLYAGKGSGSIENASSKVLGIWGKQDQALRNIELFKNTDGNLFKAELEWTPSYRLKLRKETVA